MRPARRRRWVDYLIETYGVSVRLACEVAGLSRSVYAYDAKRPHDEPLIAAILALVERHPRWGFPKIRKRQRKLGHRWNHKRIYRVYLALRLNMRRKVKRRLPSRNPLPLAVPPRMNVCWSMDFMSSVLQHGHRFRTLNIVDDFNREILAIDVNSGITAERVIMVLERIGAWRGYPTIIRVDNGAEFTSGAFTEWALKKGIKVDFTEPGCPYQNSYIERFNRTYREDVLDLYLFETLEEVREVTDDWMLLYNYERPHDSLNDMTPMEYLKAA